MIALPPLPEGSRLRVEEEADAVRIAYAVRGGPAGRLLLIGITLTSIGGLLRCRPWYWNGGMILTHPGLPPWIQYVLIGNKGFFGVFIIALALSLLILLNQVRSCGNTDLLLRKERATFDIGGGSGVSLVRRDGFRSVRISLSGRIWLRCRWAPWPLPWLTMDLIPLTFRPPTPQDAEWIRKVLAQWAGLPA